MCRPGVSVGTMIMLRECGPPRRVGADQGDDVIGDAGIGTPGFGTVDDPFAVFRSASSAPRLGDLTQHRVRSAPAPPVCLSRGDARQVTASVSESPEKSNRGATQAIMGGNGQGSAATAPAKLFDGNGGTDRVHPGAAIFLWDVEAEKAKRTHLADGRPVESAVSSTSWALGLTSRRRNHAQLPATCVVHRSGQSSLRFLLWFCSTCDLSSLFYQFVGAGVMSVYHPFFVSNAPVLYICHLALIKYR